MSTIKQKSVLVQVEGGKSYTVQRMRWRATRDFLRILAKSVVALNASGKLERSGWLEKLPEIVTASEELVQILCAESTGLSHEDFDKLDGLVALEILRASMSINCDDDLKNCLAGIAESVAGLIQQREPNSPAA